jgi:hypothetical protein
MNGYFGQTASAGSLSSTAAVGDVVLRSQTNLLFTAGGDTERMRITSAGNVGIGKSVPDTNSLLDVNGQAFVAHLAIYNNNGTPNLGTSPMLYSPASATFALSTGATERMRINNNGEFLVGTTTGTSSDPVHRIGNSGGTTYGRLMLQERVGVWLSLNTGTTNYGTVYLNGSVVVYGGQSDYRLKENIQPMSSGLDRVMALKPVTFNWKRDNSYGEGFIAHELQEVVPLAVTGTKDGLNEVGDPDWQNVDKSHIVPILVKSIQELNTKLDAANAEIEALKSK